MWASCPLVDYLRALLASSSEESGLVVLNYLLHQQVMKEVLRMASAKLSEVKFSFKDAVEDWGWKNLIEDLGKENIIRQLGEENVIRQIGEERVQRHLTRLLGKEKILEILDEG